jgi:Na+-translocating ferredoxin:NAD+ oxidoreductase RnfG subunit
LNINRKITIVIAFLSSVSTTGSASIDSISSATIDYSDTAAEEEKFKYLLQLQVLKDIVEGR